MSRDEKFIVALGRGADTYLGAPENKKTEKRGGG